MLTMRKDSYGIWQLRGSSGHTEHYRDSNRASVKFAAMVAAHTRNHGDAEKEIISAVKNGKQLIQWDGKFKY